MTQPPVAEAMRALLAMPDLGDQARALELVRSMRGELAERMGLEFTSITPERVTGTMPVAGNRQPFGLLHGGANAVLAETLGSFHAAVCSGGRAAVGIELSCTHHRSAVDGVVTGVCLPLHLGRTLNTFEIVISDEAGRRMCTARLTVLLRDLG